MLSEGVQVYLIWIPSQSDLHTHEKPDKVGKSSGLKGGNDLRLRAVHKIPKTINITKFAANFTVIIESESHTVVRAFHHTEMLMDHHVYGS